MKKVLLGPIGYILLLGNHAYADACDATSNTISNGEIVTDACILSMGESLIVNAGGEIHPTNTSNSNTVFGITSDGDITNNGTIATEPGILNLAGIRYSRGLGGGSITNNTGASIFGGSTGVLLEGSSSSASNSTLDSLANAGNISSDQTRGIGVHIYRATVSNSIANSGNIGSEIISSDTSSNFVGIRLNSGSAGGINNTENGKIYGGGGFSGLGIQIYNDFFGGSITENIVNEGLITGGSGIAVYGGLFEKGILNSGSIIGLTDSPARAAIYLGDRTFGPYAGVTVTQGITNSGLIDGPYSIVVQENGVVPTIDNQLDGTIDGLLNVRGSAGTDFTNTGTVILPEGDSYVVGSFDTSGLLKLEFSDSDYARLNVTGDASLAGNLFADATSVTSANPNYAVDVSGNLTIQNIITTTGVVTGTFTDYNDNSALFDFVPVYHADHVDLQIVGDGLGGGSAESSLEGSGSNGGSSNSSNEGSVHAINSAAGNSHALGAAQTIDMLLNDPATTALYTPIFIGLSTEEAVTRATTQTLPLLTGASIEGVRTAITGINRVIQARVEGHRGMSSGDEAITDQYAWVKPFGSWAGQDNVDGIAGFDASTKGLAIGTDKAIDESLRLGVAFAYANSDVKSKSAVAPQSADIDLYQLVGYGSKVLDDGLEMNFQVDVGLNKNKGARTISLTDEVARSSYNGVTAHAALGVAKQYKLDEKNTVTASVRGDYTAVKDESYSETGSALLGFSNVEGRTSREFIISIDGKLVHEVDDALSLTAKAGVGYDTLNETASLTAAFAGAPTASFVTEGITPDPWIGKAGFGVLYSTESGAEITADFDAEYRDSFLNTTASVKVRWAF